MSNFAVIENGVVTNCIDAPSLEVAEEATDNQCVEYTLENAVGIGWTYNGKKFTAPVIDAPSK
jgi:hypothetical protein